MKLGLLLPLVVLVLGACRSQGPRYPVERVVVTGATVVDNALLGLDRAQVQALLIETLRESRRFELLERPEEREARGAWTLTLELPFTREALKDGKAHTYAEVGASLTLERRGAESSQQYEVVGLGEVRVGGDGPESRRQALRAALQRAFAQVAESAALQLAAVERTDEELVKDLQAADGRVRELSLRVLIERRHPAAVPLLIQQLEDESPQVVRRATGKLVEMKARSAVPALIDLVKGRDLGFVQEIVFAIGEIGGSEAEAYLFTVAQGHDQPAIQAAAQQALDTLYASSKLGSPEARGTNRAGK